MFPFRNGGRTVVGIADVIVESQKLSLAILVKAMYTQFASDVNDTTISASLLLIASTRTVERDIDVWNGWHGGFRDLDPAENSKMSRILNNNDLGRETMPMWQGYQTSVECTKQLKFEGGSFLVGWHLVTKY
eukprot:scaffold4061_cov108-Cylindrotheca_fusiformis.AAC.10